MKLLRITAMALMLTTALAKPVLLKQPLPVTQASMNTLNAYAHAFAGKECSKRPTPQITDIASGATTELFEQIFALSKAVIRRQAAQQGITLKADARGVMNGGIRIGRILGPEDGATSFNLLTLQPYQGTQHLIIYACYLQ